MSDKLKIMQERINSNLEVLAEPMSENEIFALDAVLYGSREHKQLEPMSLNQVFALDANLAQVSKD